VKLISLIFAVSITPTIILAIVYYLYNTNFRLKEMIFRDLNSIFSM